MCLPHSQHNIKFKTDIHIVAISSYLNHFLIGKIHNRLYGKDIIYMSEKTNWHHICIYTLSLDESMVCKINGNGSNTTMSWNRCTKL